MSTCNDGFAQLCALGLITEEQLKNISACPKPKLLKPGAGPGEHLAWSVEQRFVTHGALFAQIDPAGGETGDAVSDERQSILHQALAVLESRAGPVNEGLLDQLHGMGLISVMEREATLRDPFPYIMGSLSRALAYVVECGAMTRERFAELQTNVQANGQAQDDACRQVVEEASVVVQALDMVRESDGVRPSRSVWSIVGEGLVWLIVALQVAQLFLSK